MQHLKLCFATEETWNLKKKGPTLKFSICSSESLPLIKRSNLAYCPAASMPPLVPQIATTPAFAPEPSFLWNYWYQRDVCFSLSQLQLQTNPFSALLSVVQFRVSERWLGSLALPHTRTHRHTHLYQMCVQDPLVSLSEETIILLSKG